MKTIKIFLFLLPFWSFKSLYAQVVSTKETFPNGENTITITFDLKQAKDNRAVGLLGKTTDVYLWSGAGTTDDGNNFEYQPTGQTNFAVPFDAGKMTSLGNNIWSISLKPRDYYKVPTGKTIKKLGLLLKSGDGKSQTEDFVLKLYDAGLQIKFFSPENGVVVKTQNEFINILANASSVVQKIDFFIGKSQYSGSKNSDQFKVLLDALYLEFGLNKLKVVATLNNQTASDSINIFLAPTLNIQNLPIGLKDGINYINDNSVTLSLFAPKKSFVYVIGEFNNWQISPKYLMNQTLDSTRNWLIINNLEKGKEYAFQYLIDGKLAVGDPYCQKILDPNNDKNISADTYSNLKTYPKENTYGGIVSVLQTAQTTYNWKIKNFKRPANKDLNVYELLVRDFVASKKYRDVGDSLGYLQKLGINAIELMPFTEFTGNDSWGYNPTYYLAADKAYGTQNDLKYLIDKAHELGISVIQDIVFNQADYEFPYVKMYWDGNQPSKDSPFFNQQATHPYSVFFDFNHESKATQNYVDRVCEFWLNEYKIDGYRFDLSKGFTQNVSLNDGQFSTYDESRVKILKRIYDKIRTYDPSAFLILEHFADNKEETELANYGFMLWGNFNNDYRNVLKGNSTNFTNVYAANLNWNFPNKIAYMESHDEERLIYDAQQNAVNSTLKTLPVALERAKLAAAFFFTIPGPKMIWQFGEFGYDISINENGRTGAKPLKWNYLQEINRQKLYKSYQALLKLRNSVELFNDGKTFISSGSSDFRTILTTLPTEKIYVLGNFGLNAITQKAGFPNTGIWFDYFTGKEIKISEIDEIIELQSGEFHVLTTKKYPNPEANIVPWNYTKQIILSTEKADDVMVVFPSPSNEKVYIKMLPQPQTEIILENLEGKVFRQLITDKETQEVDLVGLPAGIYFVRVRQGDIIKSKKFIKE